MEEIVDLINASVKDLVLSRNEKRELKTLIASKKLNQRELDLLRSKIFDIGLEESESLSKTQLIDWLEKTSKLTIDKSGPSSTTVSTYFSPGTECRSAIVNLIKNATASIKICVFTISDNEIANEIIQAHKKGIGVKILTDNDKSFDKGSDIERMHQAGLNIKIDRTESHMHHKFCIVDKDTVLTGSYNWTRSAAERNQENIIVTKEPQMVKDFLREFDKLWANLADY